MLKPVTLTVLAAAVVAAVGLAGLTLLRREAPPPAAGTPAPAGPPIGGALANFTPIEPPGPTPDVAFADAEGRTVRLSDFRGRVVLLNLWATWCAPCIEEMPTLDRLQAKMGGERFVAVAVSLDTQGPEAVRRFFEKLGLAHLALYIDRSNAFADALNVQGLPATLLLDREGRAVGGLLGAARWDAPEAEALIRHYIASSDAAPDS